MLITIAIAASVGFLFGFVACIAATGPVRLPTISDEELGIGAPQTADRPWRFRP